MALQTSGAISLNDMHIEVGGSSGTTVSLNDADIRGLIGKGSGAQSSFSEFYGAAASTTLTSAGTVNGQNQQKQITVSSFISSGETLEIPSNLWVWSESHSQAALLIDIPCTIVNYGKIIGQGGSNNSRDGGDAIRINSGVSGVTIQNMSGGYIAGGGGYGKDGYGYGGGGAGGGVGGQSSGTYGVGGSLNASGANGLNPYNDGAYKAGQGGGAGGGGGGAALISPYGYPKYGGGGGRILPGTGGAGGVDQSNGGAGGSAGNAGSNGGATVGGGVRGAGGGGGWGANGGLDSNGGTPYSGGKAINDNGVSYTLSNSGTIYGGT